MQAMLQAVQARHPTVPACCAYLEILLPTLPQAIDKLVAQYLLTQIHVLPVFLGTGKHLQHDLPALMQAAAVRHPQVRFSVGALLGERPELVELVAKIAEADLAQLRKA